MRRKPLIWSYIREYYDTILKRLREMEADLDRDAKKKLPF